MKIRVIVPVIPYETVGATRALYAAAVRPDAEISVVCLDQGPASIESDYEEAMAVPDLLTKVRAAEHEGMDAVIIDCMADPGLSAARELVSIPVVGPAQTAMHLAAMLGHRFSVIGVLEQDICFFERLSRLYGLESRLASVRPVNIPVLDLDKDRDPSTPLRAGRVVGALVEQATRAVTEDGAHVIVFGCTAMMGLAHPVELALAKRGYAVPVIDPGVAAVKLAEGLVDMRLTHSKRTYPPPKEIVEAVSLRAVFPSALPQGKCAKQSPILLTRNDGAEIASSAKTASSQ